MATTDVPAPSRHNMRLIGHTDQNGRGDGQQIMVQNGHAYIGHVRVASASSTCATRRGRRR